MFRKLSAEEILEIIQEYVEDKNRIYKAVAEDYEFYVIKGGIFHKSEYRNKPHKFFIDIIKGGYIEKFHESPWAEDQDSRIHAFWCEYQEEVEEMFPIVESTGIEGIGFDKEDYQHRTLAVYEYVAKDIYNHVKEEIFGEKAMFDCPICGKGKMEFSPEEGLYIWACDKCKAFLLSENAHKIELVKKASIISLYPLYDEDYKTGCFAKRYYK